MPLTGLLEAVALIMILGCFAQGMQILHNYRGTLHASKLLSQPLNGGNDTSQGSIAIIPCKLGASSEDEAIYITRSIRDLLSSRAVGRAMLVIEPSDLEALNTKYRDLTKDPGVEFLISDLNACKTCSGKNRALITALREIRSTSKKAIVLLDCDAYHYPKAVEIAVRGAITEKAIVTGYRWYILRDIYGALYNTVSSLAFEYMGIDKTRIVWGGLVAMPTEFPSLLNLIDRFSEELSDDAVVNIEARKKGYRVIFCPACISITPPPRGFRAFISWAVRQMIIVRLYTPRGFMTLLTIYLANTALLAIAITAIVINTSNLIRILFLTLLISYIALGCIRALVAIKIYDPLSIYRDNVLEREKILWKISYVALTAIRAPLLLFILIIARISKRFSWRGSIYCIKKNRAYPC
jgi:cellulose synthase/poly-beta-1,6-N-acetylglucosamine synthase-like glycosyltransferase